jgi:hypothetical protein
MPGRGEELRFNIIANDRASDGFSRVGRSAEGMGAKMDWASRQAASLDRSLDRLSHKTVSVDVDVNRTLKTTDRTLFDAERLLSGSGGGMAGIGSAVSGAPGAAGPLAALGGNPWVLGGGAAVALAGLPFIGAAAGGAIVGTFGAALTGLGVIAAARTKPVASAFHKLAADAGKDLTSISVPFQGALTSIADSFRRVLPAVMKPLGDAFRVIAPQLQLIGTTLAGSLANPAVGAAIRGIGDAFAKFLKAFSPQIPGIVGALAKGVQGLAQAFTDHPGMIAAMSSVLAFLFRLPGYAVAALGSLARVANWISTGFPHQVSMGLDAARKFFGNFVLDVHRWWDDVLRDTRITWNDIYGATIGTAIRIGHDLEHWFAVARHDVAAAIGGLPGDLLGIGKAAISALLRGLTSLGGTILGWAKSFAKSVLDVFHLGWIIGSPSRAMYDVGRHFMEGLYNGMRDHGGRVKALTSSIAAGVSAALAGSAANLGSGVAAEQRYAASLFQGYRWAPGQLPALIALWNRESGWNPWAVNPSSGAAGIPQNIQGWAAYSPGDWAAQIRWGLAYIFSRYGTPGAAWAHEMQLGWYDKGGYLPPGLSLAWNTTGRPEPVGAAAGGGSTVIIVRVDPAVAAVTPDRNLGRQIAEHILAHTRTGGRLYPQGTAPR